MQFRRHRCKIVYFLPSTTLQPNKMSPRKKNNNKKNKSFSFANSVWNRINFSILIITFVTPLRHESGFNCFWSCARLNNTESYANFFDLRPNRKLPKTRMHAITRGQISNECYTFHNVICKRCPKWFKIYFGCTKLDHNFCHRRKIITKRAKNRVQLENFIHSWNCVTACLLPTWESFWIRTGRSLRVTERKSTLIKW